ncbi:hypothetical protein [uncultured Georgenia sp.]|uniref:hypothetical protein n=1 Tax=uncultured Georgenia sp. TaxID=378209 RepID=UPI002635FDC6|nr:hypothetical protein [uncultured Georgenia sp.]HLV03591.1 hypothetical protein [Actinomycetaceae bacterium]
MFVVTVDQKGSRSRGDAVPALLDAVAAWRSGQDVDPFVLPLQRTVGDEVQGVLADARAVVGLALLLQRLGGWSVGIGAGPVHEPLAETAPASAGEAFVLARTAVERARGRTGSVPLAVAGADADAADQAEALLQLLAAVVRRRTAAGWEVVDLMAEVATQREAAERLGITAQAVSQRLDTALWHEEQRLHPLAARLLREAEAG